ncbi:Protein of unknown function DUF3468 [Penicillium alfredii]|uniref:Zn(2)-C6 fungal-type domain-containing protein n=1 Tax=Penicillium alfredii TaxID=1506179 RepID=A0A9W9EHA4_9EURO|nr:Protein of unknown function DUF3468 [Penicillium alfredii]KAJ5081786.1 Protein of unknown function DUF3468 [Penicillium alfredii]
MTTLDMELDASRSDAQVTEANAGTGDSAEASTARDSAPRRLPKKRTKTGCLTCRKRRIKCGEEKPTCTNCVKSKRDCEGYAPRVVFKNPMGIIGAYRADHSQNPPMQTAPVRMQMSNDSSSLLPPQQAAAATQHLILAPRPVETGVIDHYTPLSSKLATPDGIQLDTPPPFRYPAVPMQAPPDMWPAQSMDQIGHVPMPSTMTDHSQFQPQDIIFDQMGVRHIPDMGIETIDQAHDPIRHPEQPYATTISSTPTFNETRGQYQTNQAQVLQNPQTHEQFTSQQPQIVYVHDEDEDLYDVESDEDIAHQSQAEGSNQLTLIMASANHDDSQLRSFTTYLNEPNILASYHPSLASSPLNNPKTARIFAHFIHSTGPSLSIFERHATDPSIVLGTPVSAAQQGLWTYTLPLKALEHPALLQAILAISSLHIAQLQQVPTTVSLKHYHYALRRVGRAVGLPLRRKKIGTLAAALVLGYYEVISAEHSKWNNHVAGSAQLIREIDFAGLTRNLRAHRRRASEQRRQMSCSAWQGLGYYPFDSDTSEDDPFAEKESNIDEGLIGSLIGRAVNYDEFGRVNDGHLQIPTRHFSRKDIETFRIQCDLYWWFIKQDVLHSLVSGNGLFIPYYQLGQCPPRARIGRLDAIYGSADHIWLMLARITDFGARDRKRKLKALKAAGTDWRPTPELFKFIGRFSKHDPTQMPGPSKPFGPKGPPGGSSMPKEGGPVQQAGRPTADGLLSRGPPAPAQASPPMYGMIPPTGPTQLPSGFADKPRQERASPDSDDSDSGATYSEAEQEWEEIFATMDTLFQALGNDFRPLPADVTPPISTPFGPALQYRTHTIAVIWGYYYAGRILLNRLHPSMPPAMMVSAGVAAPTTAEYAQIIGKIIAGIYYPQRYNLAAGSLSPTLGSSLTDMTVPVFFAGVQYTDATQRGWTIAKLREISRLTGWKSSDAVAGGCERAWVTAAEHGRGPPYQRSFEMDRHSEYLERKAGMSNNDLRFVTINASDHVQYGFGILSLEDDLSVLEL